MFGLFNKKAAPADSAPPYPEDEDQVELLRLCRERFSKASRPFAGAALEACQLTLTRDVQQIFTQTRDPMLKILTDQRKLLERGQIFWGHLVQANNLLFEETNVETLPANALYSADHYFDGRPALLEQMARGLFAQKGSTPADRELGEFVRVITDERERILCRELPRTYSVGRSVYFTTCFIQPRHLPGNRLAGSLFPMLVNPDETEAVMILPATFWPYGLVRQWT